MPAACSWLPPVLMDSTNYPSVFDSDDLFLIICAAGLAHSVRHHQRAALAALDECRSGHLPVRSSLVAMAFG